MMWQNSIRRRWLGSRGVIVAGLVNLVMPSTNLLWTLIPICLAAAASGFAGYLVGARQKK